MATEIYTGTIDMTTDWGNADGNGTPLTGQQVQDFIKDEFGKRFGYLNMRFNDTVNMYYIECFESEANYKLYESDKETYSALRLQSVQIPISTVEGDTFTASLRTTLKTDANIVVSGSDLLVPLNYRSIKISQLGNENAYYNGTLNVYRSTDGATWELAGSIKNVLTPQQIDDTETTENINIGEYLVQGKQTVRLNATYEVTTDDGTIKTVTSGNVLVGASVTKTELKLTLMTPFYTPMYAVDEETGAYNNFAVNYRVYGAVAKTIHVKVEGALATHTSELTSAASEDGAIRGISLAYSSDYMFHEHGIRKVTAWVEAEDGLGNTITSEVLENQFMMVADESNTQKYLLLQNVKDSVTNYIQSKLADYAVYAPNGSDTKLSFQLQSSSGAVYMEMVKTVSPNTATELLAAVEIEPEDEANIPDGYKARLYAFNGSDNMISSSGIASTGYLDVYVDNKEAIVPVLGATFLMSPKSRDNGETNPGKIYNAKKNNIEVNSTWENFGFMNDGWMTDENSQKVLRVMAGSTLTIHRNVWAQYLTNPASSLTIEIDFKVSNVTNTSDPIVQMLGGTGNKGLVLNALRGWIRTASYYNDDNCMFGWREGQRQFLSVNLNHEIFPKGNDCIYPSDKSTLADSSIALARVLLNGDPVRTIPFDRTKKDEWCDSEDAAIVIGNEGADIDIYSIRIYENTMVEAEDLLMRNYPSSLLTTEEKQSFKHYNSLKSGPYISLTEARNRGLNCIVYHGSRPYAYETAPKSGYIEYFRYDQNGNPLPEYSGTNCIGTKTLEWKPQGTTAKTYYEHNQQDDNSKVAYHFANGTGVIQVAVSALHESIKVMSDPYEGVIDEDDDEGGYYEGTVIDLAGGNLGKNFPYEMTAKPYPYSNGMITVPDGWIDGNGKYRGRGYMVAEGTALAQKKVAKINYASAMQSHLIGACKSYDELHYLCVGASPLQKAYIDKGLTRPVSAKHTEPFLMFFEENGKTYFTGLCVYGAAKMDKVAWGYVKKLHPMFAMIEGSDNNQPLTDFLVPFDDNVTYDASEEGWWYNKEQSWDFDAGLTDDNDVPVASIRKQWAMYHNFVYLNSTNIKYYDGAADDFRNSTVASTDLKSKYWCTEGDEAFHLLRYDFINSKWVDAGLKDSTGEYSVVDLSTDARTKSTYEAYKTSSDYDSINSAFKEDMARFFKENGKFLMDLKSLLFNYCYVLMFLAGTDNSSKNTYFKIDPIAQDMSADANDEFSAWYLATFGEAFDYTQVYLMYMDGDDMDSILPVNNKGNLTKPYYIERLYPYADGGTEALYEGMDNQLFDLVEVAFTQDERSAMMNTILSAMQSLVKESDNLLALKDRKVSVWGFLHKYFFNVQYYFPKICYLEQARIRYEFAEVMGWRGRDTVRPVSQSIGSNVENEMQFMEQRVVYMASFAEFGELAGKTSGSVGITDASEGTGGKFTFTGSPLPNGSPATFTFTLTPHQYIYPCGVKGSSHVPSKQRTSPNETCTLTIAKDVTETTDTVLGICGINYYSDLGDFSNISTKSDFSLKGKRIRTVRCFGSSNFRPTSYTIETPNATYVSFGDLAYRYLTVDFSKMKRASHIYVNGGVREVKYPETHTLTQITINYFGLSFVLKNTPNLKVLSYPYSNRFQNAQNFHIGANVGTNVEGFTVQPIVEDIWEEQKAQSSPALQSIHVENVNWTDFDVNALSWFADRATCKFKGNITLDESSQKMTWAIKNKVNLKFGDVDSGNGDLTLSYSQTPFYETGSAGTSYIKGSFFVDSLKVADGDYGDSKTESFVVTPASIYMNDQKSVKYSVEGTGSFYSMDALTGVLTVDMANLPSSAHTATIKATIEAVSGTYVLQKTINIWNRPAQVGDLVYYDGTYCAEADDDGEKTIIGRCFYVAPTNADGSVNTELAAADDTWRRIMVAADDVYVNSSNAHQWGIYPINTGDETLTAQYSLYTVGDDDTKSNIEIDGTTLADITTITNIGSVGLYLNDGTSTNYITDESLLDLTEEGVANDGFKVFAQNTAVGDGLGAGTTDRVLDAALAALAGDGYAATDVVNASYIKTLKIIQHRNNIIGHVQEAKDGNTVEHDWEYAPLDYPTASDSMTELEHLGWLITEVREWAKGTDTDKHQLGDTEYGNRWSQLLYPAASACYAYEPTVKSGETLAPQFKAHNWALPADGLLARLFWYSYIGGGAGTTATDREDSPLNSLYRNGKRVFKKITSSLLWSAAELYSLNSWSVSFGYGGTTSYGKYVSVVGRAVSAF